MDLSGSDPSSMRVLNGDLLIHCLSFLNSLDTGIAKISCRRLLYLLDRLGEIKPALSVSSSKEFRPKDVTREALKGLTGEPNICFAFYSDDEESETAWLGLRAQLPRKCAILTAKCWAVQVNVNSDLSFNKRLAVSIGSFPKTHAVPFRFEMKDFIEHDEASTSASLLRQWEKHIPPCKEGYSVFVVYSMGDASGSFCETLVKDMQKKNPNAAIIGGVCPAAAVENAFFDNLSSPVSPSLEDFENMSVKQLKQKILENNPNFSFRGLEKSELASAAHALACTPVGVIEHGICGLAIRGNCPLRSVVSRGMRSMTTGKITLPGDRAPRMRIKEVVKHAEGATFEQGLSKVSKLAQPDAWIDNDKEEDTSITPLEWLLSLNNRPQAIGVRSNPAHGFELFPLGQESICFDDGTLLLENSEAVVQGAEVDLFSMDAEAMVTDVDATIKTLESQLHGEEVLSALMFSCGARGPQPMMLPPMTDATRFENVFKGLPLVGFYAGGEIGPPAAVACEDAFRHGKVAIQGMTVVFGVFVVPKRNLGAFNLNISAEDYPEAWANHCREKLLV